MGGPFIVGWQGGGSDGEAEWRQRLGGVAGLRWREGNDGNKEWRGGNGRAGRGENTRDKNVAWWDIGGRV